MVTCYFILNNPMKQDIYTKSQYFKNSRKYQKNLELEDITQLPRDTARVKIYLNKQELK